MSTPFDETHDDVVDSFVWDPLDFDEGANDPWGDDEDFDDDEDEGE